MKKLIIEARINEYEMRDRNPNVPWTAQEIAADATACREAGAAIVHFHARSPEGAPEPSARVTREIIARIRDRSDILVNPTLGSLRQNTPMFERLGPFLVGGDSQPDLLPLTFGSPNWDFADDGGAFRSADKLYLNRTSDLIASAKALRDAGIGVSCVVWEIGYTRRLTAFLDAGIIAAPAYVLFHLTSGGMLSGHPATAEGLDTHLAFLPRVHRAEWSVMNFYGSVLPLAEKILLSGGHLQIGLGDHPYPELGLPTNAALVRTVVDLAGRLGREIASPQEARSLLGLTHIKQREPRS